ncbi:MAG: methyltransferase domain-containing protein [Anaerolineae bacterium]|nr:methyltransferase domain-containing protein [Anaerolineae bacterium]
MPTEKEEYKQFISGVFSRTAETYSQVGPEFFQHFGGQLVDYAGIEAGDHVLDVASGRGAVLFPAVEAVGDSGMVTGIDLAQGMVARLSADLAARGLTNAEVFQMDAENLDLEEKSFDRVISGFSFFFYPNLEKALAEFHRVLKPGGVVATTTFERYDTEINNELRELAKSFEGELTPAPKMDTNLLDSVDEIQEVFGQAGFVDVECQIERKTFYYQDEEQWWQVQWSHGRRALLERMSTDVQARYRASARMILQAHSDKGGIPDEFSIIYSRARKPGGAGEMD